MEDSPSGTGKKNKKSETSAWLEAMKAKHQENMDSQKGKRRRFQQRANTQKAQGKVTIKGPSNYIIVMDR